MEVNLPMIEAAINRLFDPSAGPTVAQEANAYLTELQKSPQGWNACWELLDVKKDLKCHMVGSSMLHSKIITGQAALNPEELEALRAKLVATLLAHAQSVQGRPIAVKLVIALSAFAAQTLRTFWKTSITDMIDNLRTTQPFLLLEFLAYLPQHLLRKNEPTNHLAQFKGVVLTLCASALPDQSLCEVSLRAITHWVSIDGPEGLSIELCMNLLDQLSTYHDAAGDALLAFMNHAEWYRQPVIAAELIEQIAKRCRPIIDIKRINGDHDAMFSIYSFLTGVAETHSGLILNHLLSDKRPAMEDYLKMLLECIATPGCYPTDETLSRIPLTFWHFLLDDLGRAEVTVKGKMCLQLHPVYEDLVRILLTKCILPDLGAMDSDEKEDHRCYRQDIADCYVYVVSLLSTSMFRYLISELRVAVNTYEQTCDWKSIEACLFSLNAIGDMADGEDQIPIVDEFLNILPRIPPVNDDLMSQVMTAIGIFAEKTSSQNISHLVHLLLRGLQQPGISAAASMALKDLARAHGEELAPVANDILHAIGIVLHPQSPLPLKHRDRVRLVAIVGHVVSALSSAEQALHSLTTLMTPFVVQLSEMASAETLTPVIRQATSENLDLLQSMFSSLSFDGYGPSSGSKPGQKLVEQLVPLFRQIGAKYSKDRQIVTSLAECIRRAVPVLESDRTCPLLLPLLTLCTSLEETLPNAAVIDCCTSILTHERGGSVCLLGTQLKNLCDICLLYFHQDLHEQTDIAEAFLKMLSFLLRKRPAYFEVNIFSVDDLTEYCRYATLSTCLPEKFTFRSAITFLVQFISASENNVAIKKTLELCGENITAQLVRNMCGGVSRNLIELEADVFLALSRHAFPLLTTWLNKFISADDMLPAITHESRTNFVRRILRERSSKRILVKVVTDFTLEWRSLQGVYGRATSNTNILG